MIIGLYVFLELALLGLIRDISKKEKVKLKVIKKEKSNGKKAKSLEKADINQELIVSNKQGKFVGNTRDYAKDKSLSVREAEREFKELKARGLLVKKDGKNYLLEEV